MKHEYVDASDLIQIDMRSGNEKKLDAMLDERGANEMGAETAIVLRNIALELMAQLEQDEKTRPASDADMAVYHEISSNYNKDRSALAAQIHPRTPGGEMKPTQQETLWVALRAGMDVQVDNLHRREPYWTATMSELQKLIELALERFGAGGGEPVARLMKYVGKGTYTKKGYTVARTYEECPKDAYPNDWEEGPELHTHSSPTDLRAEYLRGLEDAAKVARAGYDEFWKRHDPEFPKARYDQASVLRTLHATVEFVSTDIADAIRALKGKQ